MKTPPHRQVPLCRPRLGAEERRAVLEVLESGWLAHGPKNAELERQFCDLTSAAYAVAMNSCTSALHLAVATQGIRGEVIVPSFTWVASANAVVAASAEPVLVDIEADTRCLAPASVEAAITPRTEAVMVVHYGGQMADMGAIVAVCRRHGLALIEDSAETIGATYEGRPQGSFGTGCFSFFPTKNITTGEGGMLTTSDPEIHRKARALIGHGVDSTTLERERAERPWLREASMAGYNFRLTHLQAAIGVEQMKRLQVLNGHRSMTAEWYLRELKSEDRLQLPTLGKGRTHTWQMFTVLLRDVDRTEFLRRLRSRGVGASVHFDPPVHLQPRYIDAAIAPGGLRTTEDVARRIVSLPMDSGLRAAEVDHVIETVRWALFDCPGDS